METGCGPVRFLSFHSGGKVALCTVARAAARLLSNHDQKGSSQLSRVQPLHRGSRRWGAVGSAGSSINTRRGPGCSHRHQLRCSRRRDLVWDAVPFRRTDPVPARLLAAWVSACCRGPRSAPGCNPAPLLCNERPRLSREALRIRTPIATRLSPALPGTDSCPARIATLQARDR